MTPEYDAAGNEIEVASGANVIERTYDDAGRLATITRSAGDVATDLVYDGRSFLRHVAEWNLAALELLEPESPPRLRRVISTT